jgi:hypothetical protein
MNFLSGLQLLFIGLKLTNYISWSWFWVFSPILIPFSCVLLIFIILLTIYCYRK